MTIDRLRVHYGFERMPFAKNLAAGMLHAHHAHQQAVARIGWCVAERQIGVITGECGAGKTVAARAAVQTLDTSRHTILYLGTPGVGLRGLYATIVTGLGATPRFHCSALIPQAQELLAVEAAERSKQVVVIVDLCRGRDYADDRQRRCGDRDDGGARAPAAGRRVGIVRSVDDGCSAYGAGFDLAVVVLGSVSEGVTCGVVTAR